MKYEPYPYQQRAEDFILDHDAAGLFLDMGLGKTAITLSAVDKLLAFEATRVLVIAPLLPAKETWPAEIRKWDHLQGITYAIAIGSADQRLAALQEHADVTIINRENVVWLVDQYKKHWPFDTVIIDELSSFKNPGSKRFRALRKVRPRIRRIIGLTGTPAPNGLLDLWSEIYLLDQGESLGRTLTSYREAYFQPDRWGPGGVIYDYKLRDGAEDKIYAAIAPICISMASAGDLPDMVSVDRDVILAPEEIDEYNRMQKDMLLPLADGSEIDAQSAAVLSGKLLQMAGGSVYDAEGFAHERHPRKLEALEQLIEEANGQSVLVFYNYKHERTRIEKLFPQARHISEDGAVEDWNAGKIPILLANPASAGHGLNLQFGGHIIVWFSPTWNLEYYEQANKRLHRRGQTKPVIVQHLIARGTLDEVILHDVLRQKKKLQDALLGAVRTTVEVSR